MPVRFIANEPSGIEKCLDDLVIRSQANFIRPSELARPKLERGRYRTRGEIRGNGDSGLFRHGSNWKRKLRSSIPILANTICLKDDCGGCYGGKFMRLLLSIAATAVALCAQQNDPTSKASPQKTETVIVTGTAEPIPLSEADRDIDVLPLPPQQRPLLQSWFDLLQADPTLDLRQRAPGSFQADLSIRGATFGQTLVLLDGMRLNDVQSGHFNLDVPMPFEAIGSIEVLKGAGSTLYGSDAIGGVVNLRARKPEGTGLRLFAGGGNNGLNQEHAVADLGTGKLLEEIAFARDFSSGFTFDRDYRNLSLSSLTSASTALGGSSAILAYSDRPFGADQFYGNYPSWERTRTWFASGHQDLGSHMEAAFAFRRHTDLFVLFRDNPQAYANRHTDESWQGNLRRRDDLPFHSTLSYGVEGLAESIDSSNLGSHRRRRASGYALYDIRSAKRFSLTAGIREEVYGTHQVATSPTLSGGVWLNSRIKLRAAASRAFRLPSYTDLYYHDPANAGNPNLKPESATSYEGGADFYLDTKVHASVTVFQRRDTNGIDYVRATVNDIWQATNFDKLHFTGVEASTVFDLPRRQHVTFAFTGLRGLDANTNVEMSKYAFNYPVHSGTAEWRAMVGQHVVARTRVGLIDRLGRSRYGLWDASAARANGRVRPFLQLTNITSTACQEIPGVVMPKRSIVAGMEIGWGSSLR